MGERVWKFPKTNPEFTHLSEREVWTALDRQADDNAIEIEAEVRRLVASFFNRYKAYIEANGLENLPPQIMHITTRCPIERVAVLIMVRHIETATMDMPPTLLH